MATLHSFEELKCWKACREVVRWVMDVSCQFPKEEKYDLKDNMRRAARSSTRNIAEGFGRFTYTENVRFCQIARGSLFEVIDDAITAFEEKYISEAEYKKGRLLIDKAIGLTNGYIRYLKSITSSQKPNQ